MALNDNNNNNNNDDNDDDDTPFFTRNVTNPGPHDILLGHPNELQIGSLSLLIVNVGTLMMMMYDNNNNNNSNN